MNATQRASCYQHYTLAKLDSASDSPSEGSIVIVTLWEELRQKELEMSQWCSKFDLLSTQFSLLTKNVENLSQENVSTKNIFDLPPLNISE